MPGSNFDRLRQMFADQFEPNGRGYLYRKSMRGAPVQVSATERDRYVATFNRYTKFAAWGLGGAPLVLILASTIYAMTAGGKVSAAVIYLSVGAIVVAFMAGHYWNWNLPERELRGRGTLGEARSRTQIRQLFLERITYGQIALFACAGVLLLLEAPGSGNMLSGWKLVPTGLSIVLFISCAILALRKWHLESRR